MVPELVTGPNDRAIEPNGQADREGGTLCGPLEREWAPTPWGCGCSPDSRELSTSGGGCCKRAGGAQHSNPV